MVARIELDKHNRSYLVHGYAMTCHCSQGQTADRVLIRVDTELGAKHRGGLRPVLTQISMASN